MASQIATGISTAVVVEHDPHEHRDRGRTEERPDALEGEAVRRERADRAAGVELDERARRRRLDEREPEERQRRAHHERQERAATRHLPGERSDEVEQLEDQPLQERDDDDDRQEQEAEPEEEARTLHVHAARGGEDLAPRPAVSEPERCDRRPGRLHGGVDDERAAAP